MKHWTKPEKGFTLAELLSVMMILGVIMTFTIPKVLAASDDSRKKTVFREAIASINAIIYNGNITGQLQKGAADVYILNHINAIKICQTDSSAQGCYAQGFSPFPAELTEPGVVLAGGAAIIGVSDGYDAGNDQWEDGLLIDWNGNDGPNVHGEDQIWLKVCYGPQKCLSDIRPGQVMAFDPPSVDLYKEIFSR